MFVMLGDLDRHASDRPDAIAMTAVDREWTFAQLAAAVRTAAVRLREGGVRARSVVAIDLPTAQEWIIDLALIRLAARSASLRGMAVPGGLAFDVLVTGVGIRSVVAPVVIEADDAWFAADPVFDAPLVEYPRPDSVFRLMLTSGTTGTPRAAAYAVDGLQHRLAGLHNYWTDDRTELNFMSLSTTGGFHTAAASLRHGTPFAAVDRIDEPTLRWAPARGIRVLCGSPMQIGRAMELLEEHGIALPQLEEVRIAGASTSPALLRLITATVGVPVRGVYGSTEGGGVTTRMLHERDDPANVGAAVPGVELQVVDDAGMPVPEGTAGLVRYRGRGLTAGYYSAGTVTAFPGGWFTPGDTGVLAGGSLTLAGRTAELINIGGTKLDPTRIDALVSAFDGITDAAAFGVELRPGIEVLTVALVAEPAADLDGLERMLREEVAAVTLWRVAEIPRNRMGKAERSLLAQAFSRTR